jgi:hypothetical protein
MSESDGTVRECVLMMTKQTQCLIDVNVINDAINIVDRRGCGELMMLSKS